jgi:hypothetical protein
MREQCVCRRPDCKGKFLPASWPIGQKKYCSEACSKIAKKLQDKRAKARYLGTEKGKRAKKRENKRYRKRIGWSGYMRAYRLKKQSSTQFCRNININNKAKG